MKYIESFLNKKSFRVLGILFAVLVSFALYFFRDKLFIFQNFGYLGLFIISVLGNATVFLPIPYFPMVFASGTFLNPFLVALSVSSGSAIGELTGYLAGISGNYLFQDNKKFIKVERWMKKYGLWTIFFLALVPNFIFDIAGIISGASKIPVRKFLLTVFVGKFLRYMIIAYLGWVVIYTPLT